MNNLETQQTTEEGAKLAVPSGSEKDPFHKLAFYNPRMSFNRSVSSLALAACNALDKKFDKITLLDGLCSTGARGIRYALENKFVKKVVFVDGNEHALELLEKNAKLNKLQKRSVLVHSDLNEFLENTEEAFDFIEVDPFGTPVPFLKNSLEKISFGKRKYGILSVTATDLAALSGKEQAMCVKNYSAKPMRCSFTHEISLRIVIAKIALEASALGLNAEPVFSFYQGHAVKTVCKISKAVKGANAKASAAKKLSENIGFVSLCRQCLHREWGKSKVEKCKACGGRMDWAGPLWLAETCRKEFIEKMIEIVKNRMYSDARQVKKMLSTMLAEFSLPPFFYDLHDLASKMGGLPPRNDEAIATLKAKGFSASLTHYDPKGIRTNAQVSEIALLLKKRP